MRGHKKSRHGCVQCKRKKVKCDETLPECGRCLRQHRVCSYLAEYGLPDARPTKSQPDNQIEACAKRTYESSPAIGNESYLIDMDLIHLYLTRTYKTLWDRTESCLLWRDRVFDEALKHTSLLDGILATTALHKVALDPDALAKYQPVVLAKQKSALKGLIQQLQSLDAENCGAVFLLSLMVCFWSCASMNLPEELNVLSLAIDPCSSPYPEPGGISDSAIDQFIELTHRIRPVISIWQQAGPWLSSGRFSFLMDTRGAQEPPDLPRGIIAAIDELESHIQQSTSVAKGFIHKTPEWGLRKMFRYARYSCCLEYLIAWPLMLPMAFIEELRVRDHAALTLVSYWAACMYSLDGRWWAHGWAEALISEISNIVTGEWAKLLEWPRLYLSVVS